MKNQYFGDINDYRKYALLRTLCDCDTHLSVCWMLTPDDSRPDGKKTKYLDQPRRWRQLDPDLFDSLRKAVPDNRRVAWAEEMGILRSVCFFPDYSMTARISGNSTSRTSRAARAIASLFSSIQTMGWKFRPGPMAKGVPQSTCIGRSSRIHGRPVTLFFCISTSGARKETTS
jgi:hypothetical protein